jgi:hypothetical protein
MVPTTPIAPGARIVVRDEEWLVRRVDPSSDGGRLLTCDGVSDLVRGQSSLFLTALGGPGRGADRRQQLHTGVSHAAPTPGAPHIMPYTINAIHYVVRCHALRENPEDHNLQGYLEAAFGRVARRGMRRITAGVLSSQSRLADPAPLTGLQRNRRCRYVPKARAAT